MDNPKSPRAKVEVAFADYVQRAALPALAGLGHYPSNTTEKKRFPCCIYYCEEAMEITPESGVFQGGLFVYVATQADDETAAVHDERLAAVGDLLRDSTAMKTAVNAGSPVVRAVTGFHLHGYFEARARDDMKGRLFGESIFYEVAWAVRDKN